jgi:hypothetical protein
MTSTTRFNRPVFTGLGVLSLVTVIVASSPPQNAPISSGMGNDDTGVPRLNLQPSSPSEQLIDRLKLDGKTQAPEARLLFMDANREAAVSGQKMLELRQRLVNLALQNKTEEITAVTDAYADAAAQMAAVEARTFTKIYAMLKPNQQSNAPQAFAIMTGMFQPGPPRAGAGRPAQRGGGGQ